MSTSPHSPLIDGLEVQDDLGFVASDGVTLVSLDHQHVPHGRGDIRIGHQSLQKTLQIDMERTTPPHLKYRYSYLFTSCCTLIFQSTQRNAYGVVIDIELKRVKLLLQVVVGLLSRQR